MKQTHKQTFHERVPLDRVSETPLFWNFLTQKDYENAQR